MVASWLVQCQRPFPQDQVLILPSLGQCDMGQRDSWASNFANLVSKSVIKRVIEQSGPSGERSCFKIATSAFTVFLIDDRSSDIFFFQKRICCKKMEQMQFFLNSVYQLSPLTFNLFDRRVTIVCNTTPDHLLLYIKIENEDDLYTGQISFPALELMLEDWPYHQMVLLEREIQLRDMKQDWQADGVFIESMVLDYLIRQFGYYRTIYSTPIENPHNNVVAI